MKNKVIYVVVCVYVLVIEEFEGRRRLFCVNWGGKGIVMV